MNTPKLGSIMPDALDASPERGPERAGAFLRLAAPPIGGIGPVARNCLNPVG
jgi:hypothetical protein